ncbi:MAG: adenosine kinase [Spirochaetes bacterium]|nr:adenosine kinase [Spirochaetota bacterium]
MKYNVFGLGNALMDIQAFIPDSELEKLELSKGIMHLVEEDKSREILNTISDYKTISIPGGSCANTMCMIALMGAKAVYMGVVGDDMYGRLYESKLAERGVKSLIKIEEEGLTGTSIILTTDDAERTMVTHLGSCREYNKHDIKYDVLTNSDMFHCTGYQLDTPNQKETVLEAIKHAKKYNLKFSFDIADPFCINRSVEEFQEIISHSADILFGNLEEARILTGVQDPVEAGKKILTMGPEIVLVKVGSEGSYLFHGDQVVKIPVYQAEEILDSTGCGDIYAGGFLYGYSKGYDIEKCAHIASYLAAQIITIPGVQVQKLDFSKIKEYIDNNILK